MIDPRQPDYTNTPLSPQRPSFEYVAADASVAPLVSIVTPFYNTRELLHETAKCMFGQSLQRWEWLIVNDASTDPAALEVLARYRSGDPRIRVIDQPENKGPGAARNAGYHHARAPYVFQMDDDDLLEPTVLEKMLWFLETHPEAAVVNGWSVAFGAEEYLWPLGFERGNEVLKENIPVGRALVRKSAHAKAGGFDESIRGGMEDWDFWLRLADAGLWGATLPEYCDWYRRRSDHSDRWRDWDHAKSQEQFRKRLEKCHARLYRDGVPKIQLRYPQACESVRPDLPFTNPLRKNKPRLLLIVPHLTMGGADKVNLDLIAQLTRRGWEVTLATTSRDDHTWMPTFARYTPDIFVLHNFVVLPDQPLFLRYLIESRRPDVALMTNCEAAYWYLPYLRALCPEPAYVDLCHSEARNWKNGGYPRYAIANQQQLDLNLVSTGYLKDWMVQRGATPERIEVLYTNVDAATWAPNAEARQRVRAMHHVSPDQAVIVFSGRLHSDKQPPVLANVFSLLAERGLDFQAWITGDGPERAWLERFIADHQLAERVKLLGQVPDADMPALFAAGDIFFLPSLWEGIALTLFEAMASGLAVVGADVGGQRELVTPECGVLLPKSDEAGEIAVYTDQLAALIRDLPRCRELGRRGRQRITELFTLDRMGDRLVELLEKARDWQRRAPHQNLSVPVAQEHATLMAELSRMTHLADELWSLRQRPAAPVQASSNQVASLLEAREYFLQTIQQLETENAALRDKAAILEHLRRHWWWRALGRLRRAVLARRARRVATAKEPA